MSTDFTGMIAFAQSLAETVKQAQTATEALANANAEIATLRERCHKLEDQRDDLEYENADLHAGLRQSRDAHAKTKAQHAEVSEALAAVNAKLDTFRRMLGLDNGATAAQSSEAQPTAPEAGPVPTTSPEPVVPDASAGTGGVAPNAPSPVGVEHVYGVGAEWSPEVTPTAGGRGVSSEPSSPEVPQADPTSSHTDHSSSDVGQEPNSSGPAMTPAPEVAEPRPTSSETTGETSPASSTSNTIHSDGFAIGPSRVETEPYESWRDSPAYVRFNG